MKKHLFARIACLLVLTVSPIPAFAQLMIDQVASTPDSPTTDPNSKDSSQPASAPKPTPHALAAQHKLGPLDFTVNWRLRTEAWDWFDPPAPGQDVYAFEHSLLRIGLGQKTEHLEWFLEGAQDAILDLPTAAVLAGRPGQLGLGGTYYAANGNGQNNANGFVRQAYIGFALPANGKLRLGRFTFLDGAEVAP